MGGQISIYKLGLGGVNLAKGPLHVGDHELLRAQNAELVIDIEEGGEGTLSKRGGLVSLGDPLAGRIIEAAEIRFIDEADLIVAVPVTQTLHPVSEIAQTAGSGVTISLTGGASTFAVVDDASDASYYSIDGGISGEVGRVETGFTSSYTPLSSYSSAILRIRARTSTSAPGSGCVFRLRNGVSSLQTWNNGLEFTLTGAFQTFDLTISNPTTLISGGAPRVRSEMQFGGPGQNIDVAEYVIILVGLA